MLQQQGPSVPVQYIRSTIIPDYDIVWQRNEEAKANYDKFYLPEKEFIKVPVNGVELNGFMVKPPNFSPSTKYPVVMTMYGGPGSIRVSRGFSFGYNEFLASNLSVIVVRFTKDYLDI
jgi:dipeptidyl aminopeptidase/acylaminoacyl peptidase